MLSYSFFFSAHEKILSGEYMQSKCIRRDWDWGTSGHRPNNSLATKSHSLICHWALIWWLLYSLETHSNHKHTRAHKVVRKTLVAPKNLHIFLYQNNQNKKNNIDDNNTTTIIIISFFLCAHNEKRRRIEMTLLFHFSLRKFIYIFFCRRFVPLSLCVSYMFVIIWWLVLPTKCLLLTHFTVYSTSFTDTHSELIYIQSVLFFMPLCIFFGFWFFLFRFFSLSPVILLFLENIRFDTVTKLSNKREEKMMIKRKTWASFVYHKKEHNKDAYTSSERENISCDVNEVWLVRDDRKYRWITSEEAEIIEKIKLIWEDEDDDDERKKWRNKPERDWRQMRPLATCKPTWLCGMCVSLLS